MIYLEITVIVTSTFEIERGKKSKNAVNWVYTTILAFKIWKYYAKCFYLNSVLEIIWFFCLMMYQDEGDSEIKRRMSILNCITVWKRYKVFWIRFRTKWRIAIYVHHIISYSLLQNFNRLFTVIIKNKWLRKIVNLIKNFILMFLKLEK